MLSSLSAMDNSLLKGSQHDSFNSTSSSSSSSGVATPRLSTNHSQQRHTDNTLSFGATRNQKGHNEGLHVDKENVSPRQTNKKKDAVTGSPLIRQTMDGPFVVFPEKQVVADSRLPHSSSSTDVPSPSTQELLRQQERQLRVLQEQVGSVSVIA